MHHACLAVRPCSVLGFYTDHMNIGIYIGIDQGHVSPQSLKVAMRADPCLLRKLHTAGVFPLMKQSSYSTDECLVSFCMCCPTSLKSSLSNIQWIYLENLSTIQIPIHGHNYCYWKLTKKYAFAMLVWNKIFRWAYFRKFQCITPGTTEHLPNNRRVVFAIGSPRDEVLPPNNTTTLKFGAQPNAMAEWLSRGEIATGRFTYIKTMSIASCTCGYIMYAVAII